MEGQIGDNHRQMQVYSFIGAYFAGAPGTRRVRIEVRCSWSDCFLSPLCIQRVCPRQGLQVADQLNSSLGCLLCGAGRASVAQSTPLINQTSQTTKQDMYVPCQLSGNSFARR